ncbi:YdcH family protein [Ciceribacter sp. L1K22]|uniref:YdcH family protein n=2 Tax=unclassified Ciceribacter TaxID=2628820 RepID=UPI001ABE1D32|nr:YdcH family protein [Ciceribacter sp. L1K22]MBO3758124.1 YdcH family protein [Ciceribacter sp. L1K22]
MKPLLKALMSRHAILATKIAEEQRRPLPDTIRIQSLKRMKLRLKEQIAMLERAGDFGASSRAV